MTGFEPVTSSLPRKCSTTELHWQKLFRAEDEAQTRDPQLGRLMLYQLSYFRIRENWLWAKMDSNHRRNYPADLQSAPFGHSGIRPCIRGKPPPAPGSLPAAVSNLFRASCRIRTNDPEITNHVLWPTELKRRIFQFSLAAGSLSFPVCGCKVKQDFLLPQNFSNYFLCEFCIFFKITLNISDLPSLKLWRDFVFALPHARILRQQDTSVHTF